MYLNLSKNTRRILRIVSGVAVLLLLVYVIWLDVVVGWWAETVILSGIAAGVLTFFLTALFIERWMSNRENQRWYPVTRLALTDILHAMADDEESDIHRGHIVPRSLKVPTTFTRDHLHELLGRVIKERDEITEALARWAQFLASSADVQELMNHIADLGARLDYLRDTIIELEEVDPNSPARDETKVRSAVADYAASNKKIIEEILRVQESVEK